MQNSEHTTIQQSLVDERFTQKNMMIKNSNKQDELRMECNIKMDAFFVEKKNAAACEIP